MREEDLIKIWQSSPNRERVTFERSRLMAEVQANMNRFQGMIKIANRRTMILTLAMIPVFAFYIYIIPFTLSKIAAILAVFFGAIAYLRFRQAKKDEPKDFTGTYSDYLHKTKIFLVGQKHLTDSSLYWTIIPGIVICILFFLGFLESPRFTTTGIIGLCVGTVVFGGIVFLLSKWWVKMAIVPSLEKVEELIRALAEEGKTG